MNKPNKNTYKLQIASNGTKLKFMQVPIYRMREQNGYLLYRREQTKFNNTAPMRKYFIKKDDGKTYYKEFRSLPSANKAWKELTEMQPTPVPTTGGELPEGFTKGEWKAGKPFRTNDNTIYPVYSNSKECETCGKSNGQWLIAWCHKNAVGKSQAEANAKLIASAPLLLEALKAVLNQEDGYGNIRITKDGKVLQEIKAAIQSATKP